MASSRSNRRDFLFTSVGAVAISNTTTGLARSLTSPADTLRLAGIGVGGMGGADLASLSSHAKVEVVALCDVDANNLAAASEKHPKAKKFTDFRKMFDEMANQIDAVHISTRIIPTQRRR